MYDRRIRIAFAAVPMLAAGLGYALLAVMPNFAAAQSDPANGERIVVPLTDPSRPVILNVDLLNGHITVTGYDGDEVVIETRSAATPVVEPPLPIGDRAGLRRIANTTMGLIAEEQNNTVSIRMRVAARGPRLAISVPRQTSVRARTVNQANLTVENVAGEHELSNVNGGITANDIEGSVVADTTNGRIEVSFTELTPNRAMSFTTFNGDIDLSLPADVDADLRIATNRGEILTDFDVEVQPRQPNVERDNDVGRYRVSLEQEVRATIGAGGPEIRLRTFNGDIVIRRR